MKLSELQQAMFHWVCAPEDIPDEGPAAVIHGGALSPSARVGIYAEMYWLRMRDVLRSMYPCLRSLVGDETFEVLVARFLRVTPSTHFSLDRIGEKFPESLIENPTDVPYLHAVAVLERARQIAFLSASVPAVGRETLAQINAETFAQARLTLTPAVQLLTLSHDITGVYRAYVRGEATPTDVAQSSTSMVVWRKGFDAMHAPVSDAEAKALELALEGQPLPVVCEPFASAENPAQAAFTALASWVNEGMVSAISV